MGEFAVKSTCLFKKNVLSYLWEKKCYIQSSFKILYIDKYNKLKETVLATFHNRHVTSVIFLRAESFHRISVSYLMWGADWKGLVL